MTTYTPATVAKALVGAVVAASGVYATAIIDGTIDLSEWALIGGAALTAFGGVFATPNKSTKPVSSPADQVIAALPTVVQQANQAAAELDRVKQATADVLGQIPVFGPLVQQTIDAVRIPR